MIGKHDDEADQQDGRHVAEAEPQQEQRRIGEAGDRRDDADQRQADVFRPARAAHQDADADAERRAASAKPGEQTEQRLDGVVRQDAVRASARRKSTPRSRASETAARGNTPAQATTSQIAPTTMNGKTLRAIVRSAFAPDMRGRISTPATAMVLAASCMVRRILPGSLSRRPLAGRCAADFVTVLAGRIMLFDRYSQAGAQPHFRDALLRHWRFARRTGKGPGTPAIERPWFKGEFRDVEEFAKDRLDRHRPHGPAHGGAPAQGRSRCDDLEPHARQGRAARRPRRQDRRARCPNSPAATSCSPSSPRARTSTRSISARTACCPAARRRRWWSTARPSRSRNRPTSASG